MEQNSHVSDLEREMKKQLSPRLNRKLQRRAARWRGSNADGETAKTVTPRTRRCITSHPYNTVTFLPLQASGGALWAVLPSDGTSACRVQSWGLGSPHSLAWQLMWPPPGAWLGHWPGHGHRASPCGLGFLTAWWLDSQGSRPQMREPGASPLAFVT